ncbi:MAG: alpha/beta hydrolase-fold protein [Candidatus Marinimicrobia bacterium]|nr:alpha/beta hydrolase-fold protein [Candidatus Neomarinimicrobiota bacterium]
MKLNKILNKILLIILLFTFACGKTDFNKFINNLESESDKNKKEKIINKFLSNNEIPIIEDREAHFIYYGKAENVKLAGDINGWNDSSINFLQVDGTNLFYYTMELNPFARIDYKLIVNNKKWILDPLNPNTIRGGFGSNSELAMSEYIQSKEIIYNKNIQHGKIIEKIFESKNTKKKYNISIYLPPNYDKNECGKYPTIYFQDGAEYMELGSAINILDNLIYKKLIQPAIAIFVTPTNRNEEYAFGDRDKYIKFFATELVSFIDNEFRTIQNADERIVIGDSYGANISALIGYYYPKIFGNCGLHSPAFQPNDFEVIKLYKSNKDIEINFYAVWGIYEPSIKKVMDRFIKICKKNNSKIDYKVYPEGHSWGLWRATTDEMLQYFIPYKK